MNSLKIRKEVIRRGISSLYHFTPLENLASILVNGLVSRRVLDEHQAPYIFTDNWRNDGQLGAVSLSIQDINRLMFAQKLRQSRCAWVIFDIDASVLWTHSCRFCWVNASSSEIVEHTGFIGGPWAFEKMFADRPVNAIDRHCSREVCGTPNNTPTVNDAEVQVLERIGPELIRDLTVANESSRMAAEAVMNAVGRVLPIAVVPDVFA